MSQRRQRLYRRLDRAERAAIERGLDKNRPARAMARDLGRSQSSVADEVRRNRTVTRGPGKGSRVESVPEGACARLRGWPHVCNGCNKRRYHCSMPFRCEYSAARAQLLADGELSAARRGVDRTEEEFESIAAKIRADLARGLSPAQIADARSSEFRAAPSTIYRWIERGYAGMSNMDLRRKVGYRPRRRAAPAPTPHGPERSFSAFSALPEGEREAACEMDTVIGRAADRQCVLTLYLRCCRAQLCLLLPERSSSAVAAALDVLEAAVGKRAFQRMFGLILTDNGAEFSDWESLERSCLPGKGPAAESTTATCASPSRRGAASATTSSCGSSCPSGAAYHSTTWRPPTWRPSCPSSTPSRGPRWRSCPRCGRSWPPTATTAPRSRPRWASRRCPTASCCSASRPSTAPGWRGGRIR